MDVTDKASEREEQLRADALAAHQRHAATSGYSRRVCVECGDEIPDARRRAVQGCKLCLECKSRTERGPW